MSMQDDNFHARCKIGGRINEKLEILVWKFPELKNVLEEICYQTHYGYYKAAENKLLDCLLTLTGALFGILVFGQVEDPELAFAS